MAERLQRVPLRLRGALADGGESLGILRPGIARLSPLWGFVGISFSLVGHLLLGVALVAALTAESVRPTSPSLSSRFDTTRPVVVSDFTVVLPPGARNLIVVSLVALAACAVVAWRLGGGARNRRNGVALLSGVWTAGAMSLAALVCVEYGAVYRAHSWFALVDLDSVRAMRPHLVLAMTGLGVSVALGLVATATCALRIGARRGWVLAAYSLVVPAVYGGFLWHGIARRIVLPVPADLSALPHALEATSPGYALEPHVRIDTAGVCRFSTGATTPLDGDRKQLRRELRDIASEMRTDHYDVNDPTTRRIPYEPLVLRVASAARFEWVREIVGLAGMRDTEIWMFEFDVRPLDPRWRPGRLHCYGAEPELDPRYDSARLHVAEGPHGTREYRIGGHASSDLRELMRAYARDEPDGIVLIGDLGSEASWGEAVEILDAAISAGITEVSIAP